MEPATSRRALIRGIITAVSVQSTERLGLVLVIVSAGLNLMAESIFHRKALFLAIAVPFWLGWAALAVRRDPSVLRRWGFRWDTFHASGRAVAFFVLPAAVLLMGLGLATEHWPPPPTFWIVLAAYPAWALAQQFLLCSVLSRGLEGLMPPRVVPLVAGSLFAIAHLPDLPLVALTAVAGVVFVALYQRWPNLWTQALGHGVLGTVAYYAVLGRDPLAAIFGG